MWVTLFFSGTVKKILSWNHGPWWFINASHCYHFKSQKSTMQHEINTHSCSWYIEVLWSKTISLCKKLNIIYNTITCNPEPQTGKYDYFHWTGTFGQIVLINWFSSLVCLHNCAMVWHICNHSRLLRHIYWCEAWVFYSMCLKHINK